MKIRSSVKALGRFKLIPPYGRATRICSWVRLIEVYDSLGNSVKTANSQLAQLVCARLESWFLRQLIFISVVACSVKYHGNRPHNCKRCSPA